MPPDFTSVYYDEEGREVLDKVLIDANRLLHTQFLTPLCSLECPCELLLPRRGERSSRLDRSVLHLPWTPVSNLSWQPIFCYITFIT